MGEIIRGILLPLAGTSLGAVCVLFSRGGMERNTRNSLNGFAGGVMAAASVWSLLMPAVERAAPWGRWAFVPAAVGFWLGVGFLLALDALIPRLRADAERMSRTSMLALAVVLHNLPEGMAVGAVYAGVLAGDVSAAGALALALGVAIQNFPEGAIVSLPLRAAGMGRGRALLWGVLSGVVEPVCAVLTIAAAQVMLPALPYCLGFAAGAMLWVVASELLSEGSERGALWFCLGFTVMMALDVALS